MPKPKKILVVDDEELACQGLKAFLTDEGYEVECALSGETGLELLKDFRPHLILLDIRMPDINPGFPKHIVIFAIPRAVF